MTFTIEILNDSGLPLGQFSESSECQYLIKQLTEHRLQPYYPALVETVRAFIAVTKGMNGGGINAQ
jgi:hypothetical protein